MGNEHKNYLVFYNIVVTSFKKNVCIRRTLLTVLHKLLEVFTDRHVPSIQQPCMNPCVWWKTSSCGRI